MRNDVRLGTVAFLVFCSFFLTQPVAASFSAIASYDGELQLGAGYFDLQRRPVSFIGYEETTLEALVMHSWDSKEWEGFIRWQERTAVGSVSYAIAGFAGNSLDFSNAPRRFDTPWLLGFDGEYVQRAGSWGYGGLFRGGLKTDGLLFQLAPFIEIHNRGRWRFTAMFGSEPLKIEARYGARRAPLQLLAAWQDSSWHLRAIFQDEAIPAAVGVGYADCKLQIWVRWQF